MNEAASGRARTAAKRASPSETEAPFPAAGVQAESKEWAPSSGTSVESAVGRNEADEAQSRLAGQTAGTALDAGSGRTLARLLVILLVAVILVNVPISREGLGLAQSVPETESVVIYDGIILQGSGPEIYVLDNHKLRPFSSDDAFAYFDRRFALDVEAVPDDTLAKFGRGRPIYHLARCADISTVYALENGQKRPFRVWLPTETGVWDRVEQVSCETLGNLPNGRPISESNGEQ